MLLILNFTSCSPSKTKDEEKNAEQNDMPKITLQMIPGDSVVANALPGNSILIFFMPDCDHCQRQAEDIQRHLETFKKYSLYFIASNPKEEITFFAERYHLQGYPNIFFAQAKVGAVVKVMGSMNVPTLCIYSPERRLIRKFDNETKVEEIAKIL